MKLRMLAKDEESGAKACPAVYVADTGELVIQGNQLDSGDMSELANPLPGETAVRISPDVVLSAMRRYSEGKTP